MSNYKLICINLKKRTDRKEKMEKIFNDFKIINYQFFEAFDGCNIDTTNPQINLFKHDNLSMLRRGVLGCALSHYNIWKKLMVDEKCDYYVVLEDDVSLVENFEIKLMDYIAKINNNMDFVFIGMTVMKEDYEKTRNIYKYDNSYTLHPLDISLFAGGAFGYILTKKGAKKLIDYIDFNGIKMAIDYLVFRSGINMYESHPHLIFTDAVQHSDHYVDSNIQRDYVKIDLGKVFNNYAFDDYIFYPNKDSPKYDIMQAYGDILNLKKIADNMNECVAFNTYGWIKNEIVPIENFVELTNKYYISDGIFIKKKHDPNIKLFNKKIELFQKKIKTRPIIVKIGINATSYSQIIVKMILDKIPNYYIDGYDDIYDISVNHITDKNHNINPNALNILISGEPWNIKQSYDIVIDTKYNSNGKTKIYYPYILQSIYEHKKSINQKDYVKTKTKFCAYMYHQQHEHRIKYFKLLSTYKHVDALGKCCNNVNIINTRTNYSENETYNDIAVEYYTNYKFVLAIENTMLTGYSTEKLLNPLIANSIPIYWGDQNIFKYINKKRVIYVLDFNSDQELLDHIKFLDNNKDAYNDVINENIFIDPNFTFENFNKNIDELIHRTLGFDQK